MIRDLIRFLSHGKPGGRHSRVRNSGIGENHEITKSIEVTQ